MLISYLDDIHPDCGEYSRLGRRNRYQVFYYILKDGQWIFTSSNSRTQISMYETPKIITSKDMTWMQVSQTYGFKVKEEFVEYANTLEKI